MSKQEELKNDRVNALLGLPGITFIRFKGAPLVSAPGTHGFAPLSGERFSALAYQQFGNGISKGGIADLQHAVESVAPDWSEHDHFIGFQDKVWDMKKLAFVDSQRDFVFSSSIQINDSPAAIAKVKEYLLQLADGDKDLAHDYIQLLAPLCMYTKPMGIVWLLGVGANGKSAFLDALYMILGKHFAEQSMDMIEDGRAAPALRGILGNIVRESSEKRIEDDKHYKNIGAHESFPIRILGTHDVVTVDANFHTIMNANNAPIFEDKSMGSRRRTLLIPFPATFDDNPHFKNDTFTPEFLGALIHLVLEETHNIKKYGYRWSKASTELQLQYNQDANTAEAFARYLDEINLLGFKNYTLLRINYEAWCSQHGMVALGRTHLVRAMENINKANVRVYMEDEKTVRRYVFGTQDPTAIVWLDNGYGMPLVKESDIPEQLELAKDEKKEW